MKSTIATIIAVLTVTSTAQAQAPLAGLSPMRIDVAGVRLGMPIEQVRTALAAASMPAGRSATRPTSLLASQTR